MKTGKRTLEIMNKADWYNNWLLKQISKYLKGDILEVGAGMGNFTSKLSKFGNVTAIDYDPEYKNANFGDIEKGRYFFNNKKKFDTIVCMNVLEHIKNDKLALKNMLELLNLKGRLVLLVPAFEFAYSDLDKNLGHFRRYTKDSLANLLTTNGYSLMAIRYLNWLGLIGWFINGRILRQELLPEKQLGIFNIIARPLLLVEEHVEPLFGLSVLVIAKKL